MKGMFRFKSFRGNEIETGLGAAIAVKVKT
jgi:hypothetical protein